MLTRNICKKNYPIQEFWSTALTCMGGYKIYHYVWNDELESNCFHVGNQSKILIEWMVNKSNDQSVISDSLYTAVWGEIYVHDGAGTENLLIKTGCKLG